MNLNTTFRLGYLFLVSILFISCSSDDSASNGDIDSNLDTSVATEILTLINNHRRSLSLNDMVANTTAKNLATNHASFMAEEQKISVDGNADRKAQLQEQENATIVREFHSKSFDAAGLVERWLASTTNKETLESENITNIGIAAVKDQRGVPYYTAIIFAIRN